ncbi:Ig-like domain-containing protein [uncultured Aquimarina sp.]|uniref:Ig-like domain-containing protein n=1 Tax=uncultured Aquimarina sp. TaxID=575652 RepID=UPI00262DCB78|nr:Ig-like domain-containing protein [uncultured Aquimarina sp.]
MEYRKQINLKTIFSFILVLIMLSSCERELSDNAEFATFPTTAEIFIDTPVGLGSDFYFPFLGSKPTAFSVDNQEGYESDASMRVDVPNADDAEGNYAGAIFRVDGVGRNLTGYDALTFWAKASQGVSIDEMGFGQDFGENKFQVTRTSISLGTNWAKYVIPIPDPSKLTEERGMLWYSTGTQNTGGFGYTFWLDEVKFERLGTVAQSQPAILNGVAVNQDAFIDVPVQLTGLTQTFNLASGNNQTVAAAPSYFTFSSTDIDVANVNELGVVSVVDTGTATITATLGNVAATGSLELNVTGPFDFAPTPPIRDPGDVVSVFSDAYTSAPIEFFNGFFTPDGQTTLGGFIDVNGDGVIRYSELNFVALKTVNRVDASAMTNIHIDIKVEDAQIDNGDFVRVLLLAQNPDGSENEASIEIPSADLIAGDWISFDRPLSDFAGVNLSNLSLFFFVSDSTISNILVDNIYFYK